MTQSLLIIVVVVIWVSLGVASAIYLARHGHRSPAWYVIGVVLGPILVPIATDVAHRREEPIEVSRSPRDQPSAPARAGASTVLLAVDGSEESRHATERALALLDCAGTRFVVLTVMDADDVGDAEAQARSEALLDLHAGLLPGSAAPPRLALESGDPGPKILEVATAEGAGLVVLGHRGRGLSTHIFGSVSDHVVRHARVPVLLGPHAP